MKYKALICDVDGTLIPNTQHGMPSKKVVDFTKKATKILPVGIATARSKSITMHLLEALSLNAPCIITGGSQIIDPVSKKILLEISLSIGDVKKIIEIGKEYKITFTVADAGYEKELIIDNNYKPIRPLDIYSELMDLQKAQEFITKISHISTVEAHKALGWEQNKKVHVIISHPLASKQNGVLHVAKMLNIKQSEIIGVGEGYNDFSFLMSCGLKVAMGNAIPEIKKIADYIAPSVENDGVADVIEKFIL